MTVKELRTLVDNLDEYIHVPGGIERLRKMVLHLAISGQLVPQDPSEGTGEELYQQIQVDKAELVKQRKIRKQRPLPEVGKNEAPFEIPQGWRWARLGEIGSTVTGKTPSTKIHSLIEGDIPFIGPGDITKEHTLAGDYKKWLNVEASQSSELALSGDILMVCIGGSIGKAALVSTPVCFNQQINKITTIESEPRFIFTVLKSEYFQRSVVDFAVGGATPIINQTRWSLLTLPLPPLAEQRRIIVKVDSIFALIDQLSVAYKTEQAERTKLVASSLAQLASGDVNAGDSLALMHLSEIIRTKADAKILRQTILHLAVSGQLVPQDPSEGTGEELYQQIQAEKAKLEKQGKIKKQKSLSQISDHEKPFAIPESWKWVRIGELSQIDNGNAFKSAEYTDKGLRVVRISNVQDGYIEDKDPKYIADNRIEEFRKYELFEGDMLMSLTGYVGRTAILTKEYLPALLNQRVARIKWGQNIDTGFIGSYLSSMSFMSAALGAARGAAQPNMSTEWLKSYGAPLPPLAEQKRIVAKTTQLLDLVSELEKHLEK